MKLLAFLLIACGPERIYPPNHIDIRSVDETWKTVYQQLQGDLVVLGQNILRDSKEGLVIQVDEQVVEREARAVYQPALKRIAVMPLETWVEYRNSSIYLEKPFATVVLAHEVGHAMGLAHSATGLMSVKDADLTQCIDRAAECLIEALDGR